MVRPLYRIEGVSPTLGRDGHAGLWYDKFCDTWRSGESWSMKGSDGSRNPKLDWIRAVAGGIGGDAIEEQAMRIARMVAGCEGSFRVFASSSRFVAGLGRSHPVENGFAWHHTLGTPYLPGSSAKGMVRAWARAEDVTEGNVSKLDRLLGSRDRAGSVSILDAIPVGQVTLEADVMTSHYANWTLDDPPGDWNPPTPIPFLTLAAESRMLFGVVPCRGATTEDAGIVMDWIARALSWQGAGAKTAVGYGRFEPDDAATLSLKQRLEQAKRAQEAEKRRAAMSPVERKIEDYLANRRDKGMPEASAIFNARKESRWLDGQMSRDEKVKVARWLMKRMKRDRTWKPSTRAKRPERDRKHRRTRQVMDWLREE